MRCWRGWWNARGTGDRVLIVEPLAGFVARWWNRWRDIVEAAGGRADEWRLRTELPAIVAKLDRAAGLNHREITGRSLWLGLKGRTQVSAPGAIQGPRPTGTGSVGAELAPPEGGAAGCRLW